MRFRDIKKSEELLKLHGFSAPDPAAVKLEEELKAARKLRRAQDRYARQIAGLPPDKWPVPPEGGLKRGPKPDPFRDKCEHGWHTQLTKRESLQLDQLRRHFGRHLTRSVFLRYIACEFLEKYRRKDCPTGPFTVDLETVDYRCKRGERNSKRAAAAARLEAA